MLISRVGYIYFNKMSGFQEAHLLFKGMLQKKTKNNITHRIEYDSEYNYVSNNHECCRTWD